MQVIMSVDGLYRESSSVLSRNTYFQLRLSIQYVKLRKNGMAMVVDIKLMNIYYQLLIVPWPCILQPLFLWPPAKTLNNYK
jgi:hypothetical protein